MAPCLCPQVSFMRDLPHVDSETADALDFEYQTRAGELLGYLEPKRCSWVSQRLNTLGH